MIFSNGAGKELESNPEPKLTSLFHFLLCPLLFHNTVVATDIATVSELIPSPEVLQLHTSSEAEPLDCWPSGPEAFSSPCWLRFC